MKISAENTFECNIHTPKKEVLIHDAVAVFIPTQAGLEGILTHHQDESFILDTGIIYIITGHTNAPQKNYYTGSGLAIIKNNKLTISAIYVTPTANQESKDRLLAKYSNANHTLFVQNLAKSFAQHPLKDIVNIKTL